MIWLEKESLGDEHLLVFKLFLIFLFLKNTNTMFRGKPKKILLKTLLAAPRNLHKKDWRPSWHGLKSSAGTVGNFPQKGRDLLGFIELLKIKNP
jgi:hypothetical protein